MAEAGADDGDFDGDSDDGAMGASGPGPSVRDGLGRSPVHVAILHRQAACLAALLKHGADASHGLDGMPLLCLAFSCSGAEGAEDFATKAAEALVAAGASLTETDDNGRAPVHWAAWNGLLAAAKAAEAAAASAADKPAAEIPDFIANETDPRKKEILMEEYGPFGGDSGAAIPDFIANETDPRKKEILMEEYGPFGAEAAAAKPPPAMDASARDRRGRSALHYAAEGGHEAFVRWLVESKDASADEADDEGNTPAHLAAANGHGGCLRALVPVMKTPGVANAAGRSVGDGLSAFKARAAAGAEPVAIITHDAVLNHQTSPVDPARPDRARAAPPAPENPERVSVLVHPTYGCLRSRRVQAAAPRWIESAPAPMGDVLRVHDYAYVRRVIRAAADAAADTEAAAGPAAAVAAASSSSTAAAGVAVRLLDADTTVSAGSWVAALHAAGSACSAVDEVVLGRSRAAFCPVRPPGHHAGPLGRVTCANDRNGSLGFCLLNNVAIAAAHARATYGRDPSDDRAVRRVVIVDFDVHHGNGTEAAVRNLRPSRLSATVTTPFAAATVETDAYKPWLDASDGEDTLFISAHGFGYRSPEHALRGIALDGPVDEAMARLRPADGSLVAPADAPAPAPASALPAASGRKPDVTPGWFYPGSGADAGYAGLPRDARAIAPGGPAWQALQRPKNEDDEDAAAVGTASSSAAAGPYSGRAPPQGAPAAEPIASTDLDQARAASADALAPGSALADGTAIAGEDATSPAVINVALPAGYLRSDWRQVMATDILPRVAAFGPDLVLISAGFDGHADDDMNNGYGVLREEDFAWVTDQLCRIAKGGRVVSVLEGGYAISAGPASPFAASVEAHVLALANAPVAPSGKGGKLAPAGWGWDAEAAAASVDAFKAGQARVEEERVAAEVRAEAAAATASSSASSAGGGAPKADEVEELGRGGRRKRGRAAVDYSKLNEELDEEEGTGAKRGKGEEEEEDGDDDEEEEEEEEDEEEEEGHKEEED